MRIASYYYIVWLGDSLLPPLPRFVLGLCLTKRSFWRWDVGSGVWAPGYQLASAYAGWRAPNRRPPLRFPSLLAFSLLTLSLHTSYTFNAVPAAHQVLIVLCGLSFAGCIVWIVSCGFYRADSFVQNVLCGLYRANCFLWIVSCGSYRADPLPSYSHLPLSLVYLPRQVISIPHRPIENLNLSPPNREPQFPGTDPHVKQSRLFAILSRDLTDLRGW